MNVGQMKKLLANVHDDIQIFTGCGDHEMRLVRAEIWQVAQHTLDGHVAYSQFFSLADLMDDEIAVPAITIE